ncbi:hypothetical protein OFB58_24525, partial [Escherichia coli]|nr:hypothetical protein [Escherichia coli]
TNRELCTLIARVNATGYYIPIYFIFKTNPIEEFINNELPSNIRFVKLPTSFSSIELTFD